VVELLNREFCGLPRQFSTRHKILKPGIFTIEPFQHPFQICDSGAFGLRVRVGGQRRKAVFSFRSNLI
jgi:hypothetical protein